MKIALISDIHGNIDAFQAVLNYLDSKNVAHIYVAGDLVGYYYYASEVIKICMERDDITCIRGNHDSIFLNAIQDNILLEHLTQKYGSAYRITKEKLTAAQLLWLSKLPTKLDIELKGVSLTLLHGSIADEDEYIYPDSSAAKLLEQISSSDLTVIGHTHYPFFWSMSGKYLLNPGSVGQPRDQSSMASGFIFNSANRIVTPFKVKFSIERLRNDIARFDPDNRYLIEVLER